MKWMCIFSLIFLSTSGCVWIEPNDEIPDEDVFSQPLESLGEIEHEEFLRGRALFRRAFDPTTLGPIFNAASCSQCHARDGRAHPSTPGLLYKVDDAVYGAQFQTNAISGVEPEGEVQRSYDTAIGDYRDGSTFSLRVPTYELLNLNYGPIHNPSIGPRLAMQIAGLGLLEAIPEADILANEDSNDSDGDGISGRAHWVIEEATSILRVGRFGWKAAHPTLEQQNAAALVNDMGLTNPVFAEGPCTSLQVECVAAQDAMLEVSQTELDLLTTYVAGLAPPVSKIGPEHRIGEQLFEQAMCSACHVPELAPGVAAYTDLLLHDMGLGLADQIQEGDAKPTEWRTPPLWGIGALPAVNGHQMLLHDGRAQDVEEAILWHGGEAERSVEIFKRLSLEERTALIDFVNAI
jgi:CxxC motif-containing protein (DUF1111 family)